MIVVGNLLAISRDRLLVGFNDPERNLTWDTPVCLLTHEAPYRLIDLVDPQTGQIIPGCTRFGPAVFNLTQHVWDMLPNFVATLVADRERQLAADRAAAERKFKHSAKGQRQLHDKQIRAQRRRHKRNAGQGTLL